MSDGVGFPVAGDTSSDTRMVVAADICWKTWLWFAKETTGFWSELALKLASFLWTSRLYFTCKIPLTVHKHPFTVHIELLYTLCGDHCGFTLKCRCVCAI